jgi:hypothetical protein
MEAAGLDPQRVIEVRGMADRDLRNPATPLDPSNRRITILLPFITDDPMKAPTPVPALPTAPTPPGAGSTGA